MNMRRVGEVANLYIAAEAGSPMERRVEANALAGRGLSEDRYGQGVGSFSPKPGKIRQVSFISREDIARANQRAGTRFTEADTRRNVIVAGLPSLEQLMGKVFVIGSATFEGRDDCAPCPRPSKLSGKEGFVEAFRGFGGLRAAVLESGVFGLGDSIFLA